MKKFKAIFIILSLLVFTGFLTWVRIPKVKNFFIKTSWAEDDEDEKGEEDDEDKKASTSSSTKTEYKIIYTKLPDQVVETQTQVPLHDTDMDGMYDENDPHPAINEFLIVKDDNLNGIDDRYDQQLSANNQ